MIASNRADLFWKYHSKNKPGQDKFFSEEFKDLIQSMFQLQPSHRPSVSEILAHEWMQGPIPHVTEIEKEFSKRDAVVKKEHKKSNSTEDGSESHETMRKIFNIPIESIEYFKDVKPQKDIQPALIHNMGVLKTQILSKLSPDLISLAIKHYVSNDLKTDVDIHPSKYKFTFQTESE